MQLNRFGVVWTTGNIAWLLQDGAAQHVLPVDVPCPIRPRQRHILCPHQIDLRAGAHTPLVADPMLEVMSPTPGGVYVTMEEHLPLVQELLRMTSPTTSLISPIWFGGATPSVKRLYAASNLGTMVWTGCSSRMLRSMEVQSKYAEAYGRRVLFVTQDRVKPDKARWVKPSLTLAEAQALPLEALGAAYLRRHMLGLDHGSAATT
jgi:hypothetical protein